MTFDQNNPNRKGPPFGVFAGVLIAIAVIAIATLYWGGSRSNPASNSGTPAPTTNSAPPASNSATTGSAGAAR